MTTDIMDGAVPVDLVVSDLDVLVHDPGRPVRRQATLVIDRGRIVAVLDATQPTPPTRRRVDGRGRIALPGLVNAHAHAAYTISRGYEPEASLDAWLPHVFAIGQRIGPDEAYAAARLAFAEMVLGGITTCVDHHYATTDRANTVAVASAAAEVGLRVLLATTAPDVGAGASEVAEAVRDVQLIAEVGSTVDGRVKPWIGLASPGRRESPRRARELAGLARSLGVPITYHYAETKAWLQLAKDLGKQRPVDVLVDTDLLGPDVLLAHGVWLVEDELDVLADTGTSVVHNPVSNLYLGDGAAPILEMLERGISVALGTDGANCNNRLDLFESIKATPLVQKLRRLDGAAMTAPTALIAATRGGAEALGYSDLGYLAPGAIADVVLVDATGPAFQPGHDPVSDLVYVAAAGDVHTVIVQGRIVVDAHRLMTADLNEICQQGREAGIRVRPPHSPTKERT
jgi:5-methylthioadenosine/S-adenosylhomocysteine deaminase